MNEKIARNPRYLYDEDKMYEILRGCDHWLYFNCEMEVSAKNFTLSNSLLGDDFDDFTNSQVVEF